MDRADIVLKPKDIVFIVSMINEIVLWKIQQIIVLLGLRCW